MTPNSCEDIGKRLGLYVETGDNNELTSEERLLISRHLAMCEECRLAAKDLENAIIALKLGYVPDAWRLDGFFEG